MSPPTFNINHTNIIGVVKLFHSIEHAPKKQIRSRSWHHSEVSESKRVKIALNFLLSFVFFVGIFLPQSDFHLRSRFQL